MKRQTQFLLFFALGGISSAHAQSRAFRVQIGGDGVFGNVSLDVKVASRHVLSVYGEQWHSLGYGGGASINPNPLPATRLDSFKGLGVSVRQPIGRDTWVGVGVGAYARSYRDSGSLNRDISGPGGKIYVGYGRGMLFGETALVAPANFRDARLELALGVRL
jgi:hypothetical protein